MKLLSMEKCNQKRVTHNRLEGLKENVICGHLIPAGTGQRDFDKLVVGAKDEFERIFANRKNVVDFNTMDRDDE